MLSVQEWTSADQKRKKRERQVRGFAQDPWRKIGLAWGVRKGSWAEAQARAVSSHWSGHLALPAAGNNTGSMQGTLQLAQPAQHQKVAGKVVTMDC